MILTVRYQEIVDKNYGETTDKGLYKTCSKESLITLIIDLDLDFVYELLNPLK